jgi:outer membrane protein assembly factor BamB
MRGLKVLLVLGIGLASIGAAQLSFAHPAGSQPQITRLSTTSIARSGRLLVSGSGFGATQGASQLVIGGRAAPITRWTDSLIVGYVPESTPLGPNAVRVVTGTADGSATSIDVTSRQSIGHVKWRFQVDAQVGYLLQRPAVGPDGTVVAHDPAGNVYALSPDGGLKWIFRTQSFASGPPSIGADGTIYVAASNTIYAIASGGALKWSFTEPAGGQGVIVGPTVGPDGNIYAVTDFGGVGALALSPKGELLWSNVGNPILDELGQVGAEVAFGASQPGGFVERLFTGVDRGVSTGGVLRAFTLRGTQSWAVAAGGADNGGMQAQRQPVVGPDGTVFMTAWGTFRDPCDGSCLYAFDPASGAARWTYSAFPANGMSEPTVGTDGTIYIGRSLSFLDAVTPAGTTKWSILDGGILAHPTVDPGSRLILSGEAPNYGEPGNVRAFSTRDGHLLWQLGLPSENGGFQVLYSRPRFAPNGQTAYFGTFISAPQSPDQYANLYAVDTRVPSPSPRPLLDRRSLR